jgi:hypothetical protein
MIYRFANARALGFARILIFAILLVDLLTDPMAQLALVPLQTFYPHGILSLIPEGWFAALLSESALLRFQWGYGLVLILGLLGYGPRLLIGILASVGTIWFHGIARGYGGHVNHQELIALHCLLLIVFFPHFDGLSLSQRRHLKSRPAAGDGIYAIPLVLVCFFLALSYYMVGLARVTASDFAVYFTNTMPHFAAEYSLKWNYWDISWGKYVLDHPTFAFVLQLGFPIATLLELVSPIAMFWRRFRMIWLVLMVIFHVLNWPLLNIFFWQHLCLLALFAEPFARRSVTQPNVVLVGGTDRVRRGVRRLIGEPSLQLPATDIRVQCEPKTLREWRDLALHLSPVSDLAELLAIFPSRIAGAVTKMIVYAGGVSLARPRFDGSRRPIRSPLG